MPQDLERKRQRLEELRNLGYSDPYGVHDRERRELELELGEQRDEAEAPVSTFH